MNERVDPDFANVVAFDPPRRPVPAEPAPIASVETEQGLIGCILTQPHVFPLIQHLVAAEQFFEPVHRVTWEAIVAIAEAGDTPNLMKVRHALGAKVAEQDLGGLSVMAYLVGLTRDAAVQASAEEYARTVQQYWQIREIAARAGRAATGEGFVPGPFLTDLYARIDQVRASFVDRKVRSASLAQAGDVLMSRIEASLRGDVQQLPPTGVTWLDEEIGGGLAPSSLITLGARTAVGKSVVGVEIARSVARAGFGAVYHSLEMPVEQVVARLASSRLFDLGREIPFSRLMKRSGVTKEDASAVAGALHDVRNYPLTIEDGGGRTIGDIAAASDRLANAYARKNIPLGVIVIDHAHIVKPSRHFNREDEGFKEIADGSLALAKHLDTCVLLLAQLNRGTEGRDDKRPGLADLRGAGAFEEDSDAVIFLYRAAYYLERSPKFRAGDPDAVAEHRACCHELEFIIDKNRAGRSNAIVRAWIDPSLNAVRNSHPGA